VDVCCGKNPRDQTQIFLEFMWLESNGQMEVVIVDVLGRSFAAFVKGTAHSCVEKQKIFLIYMKKA
jgi:hypothetical protein